MTNILVDDLPGLRAFATDQMGFDPWRALDRAFHNRGDGPLGSMRVSAWWKAWEKEAHLPLSTATGFALGVAFLAHRLGLTGQWAFYETSYLLPNGDQIIHFTLNNVETEESVGWDHEVLPALADIPKYCETCGGDDVEGEWQTPGAKCPGCTNGINPQRVQQALAACLLSEIEEE